jgi:hypothetical protein
MNGFDPAAALTAADPLLRTAAWSTLITAAVAVFVVIAAAATAVLDWLVGNREWRAFRAQLAVPAAAGVQAVAADADDRARRTADLEAMDESLTDEDWLAVLHLLRDGVSKDAIIRLYRLRLAHRALASWGPGDDSAPSTIRAQA